MAEGKKEQVKGNSCICLNITCDQNGNELCSNDKCTTCKSCCEPQCKRCKEKCKEKQPCKCHIPRCGCEQDCYGDDKKGECKGKTGGCKRCEKRCKNSEKCICYFCSCGTKCNGVICSCCSWCDPKNCSGKKCDGYVIGRCGDKGKDKCGGHVKYDNDGKDGEYGAVLERNAENQIKCDGKPHEGSKCTDNNNNCNWLCGELQPDGNCVKLCTYCGDLCGQDKFRRCCYIAIPLVITVLAFLILRFMLPEKFHAITSKIRAAFPSSPWHPSRSTSNLVGDKIPEEMNTDRYPAFRPMPYAGLA